HGGPRAQHEPGRHDLSADAVAGDRAPAELRGRSRAAGQHLPERGSPRAGRHVTGAAAAPLWGCAAVSSQKGKKYRIAGIAAAKVTMLSGRPTRMKSM